MAGTFLKKIDWSQLLRYYQAGIINTLFGYACFALLIWLSVDMLLSQLISHIVGTIFNYLTYSGYAFRDEGSLPRFMASYVVNYLMSLGAMLGLATVIKSPYMVGGLSIILVSAINFLILKKFVFGLKR